VRNLQFAIPRLEKDFLLLKESTLLQDIDACSDKTIYSKVAALLEVLDHKIQVLGALAKVC